AVGQGPDQPAGGAGGTGESLPRPAPAGAAVPLPCAQLPADAGCRRTHPLGRLSPSPPAATAPRRTEPARLFRADPHAARTTPRHPPSLGPARRTGTMGPATAAISMSRYFSDASFKFLRNLDRHNDKPW